MSINELFNSYVEWATAKGRTTTTLYIAQLNFKKYVEPAFAGHDLVTLTIEQHENFLNKIPQHFGIKPATVNRIRSLLQVMYSVAVKKRLFGGVFTSNPYGFIEKGKETRPQIKYWDKVSLQKFLNHAKGTRYYPLWVLLLNTGMRIGEAVALDRSQVDTFAHVITVRRTWCPLTKKPEDRTKGRRSRKIGIKNLTFVRNTLYPVLPESGLVFTNEKGEGLKPDWVHRGLFTRTCREALVEDIGVHGLRHTFASHYMMNNGNINDLAEILGHSDVKVTRDYYIHFSEEHIQRRGKIMEFGADADNVISVSFNGGG